MAEPETPTRTPITPLPHAWRAAYAVSSLQQAHALFTECWPDAPQEHIEAIAAAIRWAESHTPAGGEPGQFWTTSVPESAAPRTFATYAPQKRSLFRPAEVHFGVSHASTFGRTVSFSDGPSLVKPVHSSPQPNTGEPDPDGLPPSELLDAQDAEEESMQRTYPGEYVAYRDVWEPPLLRREVVAHAPGLRAVLDAFEHIPTRERELIEVTYCDPVSPHSESQIGGGENPSSEPAVPPRAK